MDLIELLHKKQKKLKLSDGDMAKRLGISRAMWVRVRMGTYPNAKSALLLRGVLAAFPELSGAALSFFGPSEFTEINGPVTPENEKAS